MATNGFFLFWRPKAEYLLRCDARRKQAAGASVAVVRIDRVGNVG